MQEEAAAWTSARLCTGQGHPPFSSPSPVQAQLEPKVLAHTSWLACRFLQRLIYVGTPRVVTFPFYVPECRGLKARGALMAVWLRVSLRCEVLDVSSVLATINSGEGGRALQ